MVAPLAESLAVGNVHHEERHDREQDSVCRLRDQDELRGALAKRDGHDAAEHEHDHPDDLELDVLERLAPAEHAVHRVSGGKRGRDGRGEAGGQQADADHKRCPGAEQRLERHGHVLAVGNGDAGVAVDVRGSADEDGHRDDAAKADGEHGVKARVGDLLGVLEALGSAGGMQEQVVRHDRGADEADGGEDALGSFLAGGQLRREQACGNRAPINGGEQGGHEEHDAHEYDDAREDLLDQLVGADPHAGEGEDAEHDDDRDHRHVEDRLDAQDAARDVAGFVGGVANEDCDDNNHDCNPFKRRIRNAIADVLTQTLLGGDADARGHFLEDDGRNGCEQEAPQHRVAVACTGNRARGNRAGADEASCYKCARADVLELFLERTCHFPLLSLESRPFATVCFSRY